MNLGQSGNALIFLFGANIILIVAVLAILIVMFLKLADYFLNYKNFQVLSQQPVDYYKLMVDNLIDDISMNIFNKKFAIAEVSNKSGRVYITPAAFEDARNEVYTEVIMALSPSCRNGLELLYAVDYVNIYLYKRIEEVCISYAVANNVIDESPTVSMGGITNDSK